MDELMQGAYPNETLAYLAVDRIKASHGIWPGVIHRKDGSCDLTHSPDTWDGRRDGGR